MAGESSAVGAQEQYRRSLQALLRANSGMLMNALESAASSEHKGQLRGIIEAAFFLFAGEEEVLPGGRDFWLRMKNNISPPGEALPPEEERARSWNAVGALRRELDRHAAAKPDFRSILEDFDSRNPAPPATGTCPAPAPRRQAAAAPLDSSSGVDAELTAIQMKYLGPPSPPPTAPAEPSPPPFATVLTAPAPPAGPDGELLARVARLEAELHKKGAELRQYDEDLRRLNAQLRAAEAPSGANALEEKFAIAEEETRLARSDLAKLEKKYRENLELLKEEARDRGSLQKQLEGSQADFIRAQERLKDETEKLSDARRRLDKKERELESLDERLHALELELVRKEEDINMAMQHLRDEEAERRRVLEALRQEAREKAQMEHRLKRREEELSRLEVRIVEEEKRIEALKGSQAVSEEGSMRKAGELKKREDDLRALQSEVQARMDGLLGEEDRLKERISKLRKELRDGEVLETQLQKREELRAALEARYRQKEDELVRELKELERLKAGYDVRCEEAARPFGESAHAPPDTPVKAEPAGPAAPALTGNAMQSGNAPSPAEKVAGVPPAIIRPLVVSEPENPLAEETAPGGDEPTTPARLFPAPSDSRAQKREELLDQLARKRKGR